MEQEDEDICDKCHQRNLENEPTDMFWIGCDFQECGKWFHTKCIGMTTEKYYTIQSQCLDWFCKQACEEASKSTKNPKQKDKKK